MSSSGSNPAEPPHVAFLPSGMGQLTPFFRLATKLASRNCTVTFINIQPSGSALAHASTFFNNYPQIKRLEFNIIPLTTSNSTIKDPFIIQIETINSSLHLLPPLLSSLPQPLSAIFSDFVLASGLTQITAVLKIQHYIVSTTSARFYSTVAYLPILMSNSPSKLSCDYEEVIEIPGLSPLAKSSIPPPWLDNSPSNYLLKSYLIPNAQSLPKVNGVLLNTFSWFEEETIDAINKGRVLSNLPPIFAVGPFELHTLEKGRPFAFLDSQPAETVVYVRFGSREAMSADQIREIGHGLETSGHTFLWVLKENFELLGDSFLERTKNKGRVIEGLLINEEDILGHPAIGGFVNECEWGSVMEVARLGVPMLGWPQHGDQKMNAELVAKMGLGMWVESWGWSGERLVKGEEIGETVRQMMRDLKLRNSVKKVAEEARKACEINGSSGKALIGVAGMLSKKDGN